MVLAQRIGESDAGDVAMSTRGVFVSAMAMLGCFALGVGLRSASERETSSERAIRQKGQPDMSKASRANPTDEESRPARPRTPERADERERMVRQTIASRGVQDPRVLDAMRQVPRHWFIPESGAPEAYKDRPLSIGHRQTISQPYIVALMTELLELEWGEKVLEVGTGSGYQAAVLAELTDQVYTIEIVEPLAKRTIKLLAEKGYDTIHTRIGDGYRGWPEAAPFDAIIVTCAPDEPPPPLVGQLAVGGRMCIPVGDVRRNQELILLVKNPDGSLERRDVIPVRFVPMTGQAEEPGP